MLVDILLAIMLELDFLELRMFCKFNQFHCFLEIEVSLGIVLPLLLHRQRYQQVSCN